MARTIDNLGVEISTQYAENREAFDESLIKESISVPNRTKIDVTLPFFPSEFERLFDLGKQRVLWSSVLAPPNYYKSRRSLFSMQMIPSLGSLEMQENQIERLKAFGEKQKQEHGEGASQIDNEKEILLKLLTTIHTYDEQLIDTYARMRQYRKG